MPRLFFCGSFESFGIDNFVLSIKIALATPKIMHLGI